MGLVVDALLADSYASLTSKIICLDDMEDGCAITATYSNAAPAAKAFVAADVHVVNNTVTEAAHGFVTGTKVQLTTTGVLPAGLAVLTDYFIIAASTSLIKFAASLVDSAAGTAINITDAGDGGTHTITAVTSTGNVLKLQAGNDGTNFEDISGNTVTIATTAGTKVWNMAAVRYRYIKVLYTPSAGQIVLAVSVCYRLRS